MNKIDIPSLSFKETEDFILGLDEKKFRAKQIYEWVNKKYVSSFAEMANIPKVLQAKLGENAVLSGIKIAKKLASQDNFTIKYLFELENNNIIENSKSYVESVLMRYAHGNTVCVSTQVGCKMGCVFCASTENGFERNLTAGEIAAQVYEISKDIDQRISNIVLMGSGEPLDNFDNVLKFIDIINSAEGSNIGQRHITLSTCGIVGKINDLLEKNLQITLAVSLHAPNDEIRRQLMPVANKYSIEELLKACKEYSDKTKRRITFEYAMIDGVNDSKANALELAKKLRNMLCHVNIIPVNEVKGKNGSARSGQNALHWASTPTKEKIDIFAQTLKDNHIEVTVRRKLGEDINAACGQLRNNFIYEEGNN